MKNKGIVIAVAVIAVIALAIVGTVYYYNANSYVATVAGEKITKSEYRFFLAVAKDRMETEANLTTEEAKKNFWKDKEESVKNAALDLAKEFKIQLIKAKDKKITISKEDTDTINKNIDQMIQAQGGKAKSEEGIKSMYGINLDEYRAIYKDYMVINKFVEEEKKTINVTEEDTKKYYEENKANYEQVTVRHILLSTVDENRQPLPQEKQDEAKKKADEVLAKVKAGEDFATLAKENSEDPGSKDSGGEYTFPKGQMVPEFEAWSFDTNRKSGDVDIVKTQFGYHVMKFEKQLTFEDFKESIKGTLTSKKYIETLDQWKKDSQYNVTKNANVFNSIKAV